MRLQVIRRLNLTINVLFVTGLVAGFLGFGAGVVFGVEPLFEILFAVGCIAICVCMVLTFVVDRVRCPNCGKPFNRPDYGNWFVRNFAKTQTRRSCVHCDYGRTIQDDSEE
ncbi:MAG: hypothetical protein GXX96_16310 [Planctomycetaceae bacterium]|nr:hypothetical protein [Planctomycetaceae bacterium]